jgi:hypothetical protein
MIGLMARVSVTVAFVGRGRCGRWDIEAKICRDAGGFMRRKDGDPAEQALGQRKCRPPAFAIFFKSLVYEQQV